MAAKKKAAKKAPARKPATAAKQKASGDLEARACAAFRGAAKRHKGDARKTLDALGLGYETDLGEYLMGRESSHTALSERLAREVLDACEAA